PPPLLRELETLMRVDLRAVRIHVDAIAADAAETLDARAFTVGQDIYFAAGAYTPDTAAGVQLLLHELTHVRQHQGRLVASAAGVAMSRSDDLLEREAEGTAAAMAAQIRAPGESSPAALIVDDDAMPSGGQLRRS